MEHSLMKDSGVEWIGEIPENWHTEKLLNLLRCKITDGPHETPDLVDDGIPFVSVDSLNETEDIDFSVVRKFISEDDYNEYRKKTNLEEGDILFSKAATIGKTAIVKKEKFMIWSPLAIVKSDSSKCYNKYLYYVLNCDGLIKHIGLLGGYNTQVNVGMRSLECAPVPVPPLAYQLQITRFLDSKTSEIKSLIDNLNKQIESLKEYKKSFIYKCVTKGLDDSVPLKDSGIEWIGEIPENWIIRETGNFYRERVEKVSATDYQPLSVTKQGVVPQLETAAKSDDFDNRKLVRKNDFAINSRSDRRGSCGISEYDGSVSLINTILEPLNTIEMSNKYFEYVFHTDEFADEFYKWGHGIVDDLWTTKWQEMKKITLPCPPLDEQINISNYLNKKCLNIDSLIFSKQKAIDKLNEYQKSLIYEYVTGKKEVIIEGLH